MQAFSQESRHLILRNLSVPVLIELKIEAVEHLSRKTWLPLLMQKSGQESCSFFQIKEPTHINVVSGPVFLNHFDCFVSVDFLCLPRPHRINVTCVILAYAPNYKVSEEWCHLALRDLVVAIFVHRSEIFVELDESARPLPLLTKECVHKLQSLFSVEVAAPIRIIIKPNIIDDNYHIVVDSWQINEAFHEPGHFFFVDIPISISVNLLKEFHKCFMRG